MRLRIPQLRDTAAMARAAARPASLKAAAEAMHLPIQKDTAGPHLLTQLSRPRRPTKNDPSTRRTPETHPEKFQQLYDYCRRDVETTRALWHALPPLPPDELRYFHMVLAANARGLPLDVAAIEALLALIDWEKRDLIDQCCEITGGVPPSRVAALREWLLANGCETPDLSKATVADLLENAPLSDNARAVLEIRQKFARSSTSKYQRMLDMMCHDQTVKGHTIYHGAKTGRNNGAGVQFLNLPRGTVTNATQAADLAAIEPEAIPLLWDDVMAVASAAIRGMVKAPPGYRLVVADFSQIEARIVVWGAKQWDAVEEYRRGDDAYRLMAADLYGVAPDRVTPHQRQIGKALVLGAGFGLGWRGFLGHAAGYGIALDEEEAKTAIGSYRRKHKKVVSTWYALEEAAIKAIQTPGDWQSLPATGHRLIVREGDLHLALHSGRTVCYPEVELAEDELGRTQIMFSGQHRTTRKWCRLHTYGGDLWQSWVQATARDIMMAAWRRIQNELKWTVLMSVHDELVVMAPASQEGCALEAVLSRMIKAPEWAKRLPLAADGFTSVRYKK